MVKCENCSHGAMLFGPAGLTCINCARPALAGRNPTDEDKTSAVEREVGVQMPPAGRSYRVSDAEADEIRTMLAEGLPLTVIAQRADRSIPTIRAIGKRTIAA